MKINYDDGFKLAEFMMNNGRHDLAKGILDAMDKTMYDNRTKAGKALRAKRKKLKGEK